MKIDKNSMFKSKQGLRRTFRGKLTGFESQLEKQFEKKHLKAYLNGRKFFTFGKLEGTKEPAFYAVQEKWLTPTEYTIYISETIYNK